jgi:hypothetical protein
MNDQSDDTTQTMPAPDPSTESSELDLSQWRKIAIVTSSLFVATLALLGWQMSSGNDPALSSQQFRGPGVQSGGQQLQGGPPNSTDGSGQGTQQPPQMQDGQQDGSQSQQAGPRTGSS